jgi:antitoxin ParD1/3/4
MATIEKISIALPLEMITLVRGAVEAGEFASTSEVVRDALRDWTLKRNLRQEGVQELRRVWQQAMKDQRPRVAVDDVFDRLEAKYKRLAPALNEPE